MADQDLIIAIGARLTHLIDQIGESQRAVARRVGVSSSFISAVAAGRSQASIQLLVGLRREYDVNLDWLLMGSGAAFGASNQRFEAIASQISTLSPENLARLEGYLAALRSTDHQRAQAG